MMPSTLREGCYLVGIEVNATLPNRRPSTATFPVDTWNCAEPRLFSIAESPERFRRTTALFPCGGNGTVDEPMLFPLSSRTAMVTVV